MTREERKLLKHMQGRERQWLRKQSATRRKAAPPRQRFDTRSMDWDDEDGVPEAYFRDRQRRKAEDPLTPGLVMAIGPGFCRVLCGKEERQCRMRPELAVGDRVLLARREIDRVLPRTTTLSRPDP